MEATVSLWRPDKQGRGAVWHKHRMIIKACKILFEPRVLYRHSWLVGSFHWHYQHANSDIR